MGSSLTSECPFQRSPSGMKTGTKRIPEKKSRAKVITIMIEERAAEECHMGEQRHQEYGITKKKFYSIFSWLRHPTSLLRTDYKFMGPNKAIDK